MKRIILCEGKTDAILISYFLEKRFGWAYSNPKKEEKYHDALPQFPVDPDEEFNWYRRRVEDRPKEMLAIWGVGGIANLPKRLKDVVGYSRTVPQAGNENRFSHIVLFLDHDDPLEVLRSQVETWVAESGLMVRADAFQIGQWLPVEMALAGVTPARTYALELLVIVVPPDHQGALERFLIDCWKHFSEADAQLAEAAQAYIKDLPPSPKEKYLNHRRLPDKACLSAIFSVVSPDRVFDKIHPRLREVPWDRLADTLEVYGKLGAL
jgi:hypothetical protein